MSVEPTGKNKTDFYISYNQNKKNKKYYFRAKDQPERDCWIKAIMESYIAAS